MPLDLRIDDLSSPQVQALIAEHLAEMRGFTPLCHAHALAVDDLRQPHITFWSAWSGDALAGCGALKALDATSGEIKSMRTRAAFRGQGIGQAVIDRLVETALERNYQHLFLETGTGPTFAAAHRLYLRNRFEWCGPFGEYTASDYNVFMTRSIRRR